MLINIRVLRMINILLHKGTIKKLSAVSKDFNLLFVHNHNIYEI